MHEINFHGVEIEAELQQPSHIKQHW